MATHSSVLAWRIPGTGKPRGLPSMGSQNRTRLKRLSSGSTVYNQLPLLIMNHGCNLIVSPFNTVQARVKEFGDVGLSSTFKIYKVFTKVDQGP